MSEIISVKGLMDLQKFLDLLPQKIERNIIRGALRAGAVVIKDAAKEACPVGEPSDINRQKYGGYAGALRDSIRVSTSHKGKMIYSHVKAGGKTKKGADVYYAHIIEFTGAAPHPNRGVIHPGMDAIPFMRPAFDKTNAAAVIAVGNYIKNRLATKHGLDTADIVIEED